MTMNEKWLNETVIQMKAAKRVDVGPAEFARWLDERPGAALRTVAMPLVKNAAERGDGKGNKEIRKLTAPFIRPATRAAFAVAFWQLASLVLVGLVLVMCWVLYAEWFGLITTVIAAVALVAVLAPLARSPRAVPPIEDSALADELAKQLGDALASHPDIELEGSE